MNLDFRALFEGAPSCFLVLEPGWNIVAVSDAYLNATMTERQVILGRHIFDVFPDNPDDPEADGVAKLSASLERVAETLQPDTMPDQHYDIRRPDEQGGGFEVRYWRPVNVPIMSRDGRLEFIIHRVDDVTVQLRTEKELENVLLRQATLSERDRLSRELSDRVLSRISASEMALTGLLRRTEDQDMVSKIRSVIEDLEVTLREVRSTIFPSVPEETSP